MIEKFVAKLIEQSLDELKFKNLSIVVPLTSMKLDNICKSLFGTKAIIIDLIAEQSVGDVAAQFTNAEEDGTVVLKNVRGLDGDKLYFLTQILAERQLLLQLDGQSDLVKFPISSCPIIALLENADHMSAELAKYFNFRLDISSSELPEPLSDISSEHDAIAASSDSRMESSSSEPLTTAEIYDWRDSGREPDLDTDLIRIRNVVFRPDEDVNPTSESYEVGTLQVIRSYLNYLISAYGPYRDFERDICDVLVRKDGVYRDILVDVYNKYANTDPASSKSASEFFNDDDCSVYYGDFEEYMNDQPLKVRREFAYRILVLFDSYQYGGFNLEPVEIDPAVPLDLKDQIVRLIESVSWKLKQNSQREDVEIRFHSESDPEEERDQDGLTSNEDVDGMLDRLNIVFNIRLTNAVTGRDEESIDAEFEIDPSDAVVVEKIKEFLSTQSRESFCYLIYNFISRTEEELENGGLDRKYIDYFNRTLEILHRRKFGWASYGIYVNGLSINESSWTRDDDRYQELFANEWANTIDAHAAFGDTVKITNGWGTYEQALQDMAENQSSSD